jgi:benzoyl-CoA reductase/2-hydroxyglutaryl-CoA dehydratase subunit BcrC/BadD/HgdB
LEVKNPIGSIAKKILSNIWQGPLEKRLNAISEMIKDYSINGVIHFSPWGCRQGTGASSIIGDFLKENGIPFLLLPGDSIDPNNYSAGQTRTRLEAFLEIVV